ncbi:MAG: glycine zipper 2TM domain-containing protein [Sphingomonadales bacterium]|nr:glycine zipper 2TM domain-containing protein [Sphingomonadales bacterium]
MAVTGTQGEAASRTVIAAGESWRDHDDHGWGRERGWGRGRSYGNSGYYGGNSYYGERSYDGPQSWRGEDGRYYCRRPDGTTGLIVGGAVGGVIGHEVAGRRGDRTLGTILGMAGGALLGRAIDRNGSRCR